MIKRFLFLLTVALAACSQPKTSSEKLDNAPRIITAGGTVTEIVYELGLGDQIIATDITSTYPASMQELPSIGYRNQIKAEGILALGPDMILMEDGYLSEDVISQLKSAQIQIHSFAKPVRIAQTKSLIKDLGELLEKEERAEAIATELSTDISTLESYLQSVESKPRAAFIMARGPQTIFLAGEDTFAEEIFGMARLEYPETGFKDFVPLTPESLVKLNPDYLIFFESGLQSLGGVDGLANIQGLNQTQAFKSRQVISLDGNYLSGFGPRVGKAALDLAKAARGE